MDSKFEAGQANTYLEKYSDLRERGADGDYVHRVTQHVLRRHENSFFST
jgi:hypothetical protein